MFMSAVAQRSGREVYPELAGARVVITGLTTAIGVDLALAFAERSARIVIQSPERSPEVTEVVAMVSKDASEFHHFGRPFGTPLSPVAFAQDAARLLGGVDVAINLVTITAQDFATIDDELAIEEFAVAKLSAAAGITRTLANRMRVTWTEGLILNVVIGPEPATAAERVLIGYLRAAVAAMTRIEAEAWAGEAIRINAIAPPEGSRGPGCLTTEPDIAALALYLASRKGRGLTGHVFDATGASRKPC
jgi:3-oxoacyl-[acyl-carrier protein] reductase